MSPEHHTPVLHLLAGSNGAGKTTLAVRRLIPVTALPFVNADVIAAELWPGDESRHAYEASGIAARRREALIRTRSSFITETVFSHPSKVQLVRDATAAGYQVHLHVVLIPEDVAVGRVRFRVENTLGHHVPEAKIRERHQRLWPLVAEAIGEARFVSVYDNSRAATPFREVARYESGLAVVTAQWPIWTPRALQDLPGQ